MNIRNAGGVVVFSAMAVLGIVGLATGHEASGLVALVIGGPVVIVIIARLARRR
jgi:Na+/proline symporter